MKSDKYKSCLVDEIMLKRAKKALGVHSDAEAIRLSVECVVEMDKFWTFMNKTRKSLKPGSVERP